MDEDEFKVIFNKIMILYESGKTPESLGPEEIEKLPSCNQAQKITLIFSMLMLDLGIVKKKSDFNDVKTYYDTFLEGYNLGRSYQRNKNPQDYFAVEVPAGKIKTENEKKAFIAHITETIYKIKDQNPDITVEELQNLINEYIKKKAMDE